MSWTILTLQLKTLSHIIVLEPLPEHYFIYSSNTAKDYSIRYYIFMLIKIEILLSRY